MHASSMENMRRCIDWYLPRGYSKVLDLGAMNVNGSYRELFAPEVEYVGVDLSDGPGVDVVLTDVYQLPFEDASVDVVLSGQMLEHSEQFWRVFTEMARVLRPGGVAFVIAPSSGPVHRYPVDCYRFYPDAYAALAGWAGLRLVHVWMDERGPWCDLVGVFQKGGSLQKLSVPPSQTVAENAMQTPHELADVEVRRGARPYLEVLADLHSLIRPALYLEIGVRRGMSLALASGRAVAVDPDPHPDLHISRPEVAMFRCTSDDFFFFHANQSLDQPVQLAFIDGMHLAEYVFRDFMNVERFMDRNGVIVIDDVLPNHPVQAQRVRQSQVWAGDVWRFAEFLKVKRPDLVLTWLDTDPSGLLLIAKPDAANRILWQHYNPDMNAFLRQSDAAVPEHILTRAQAIAPTLENVREAIER